MELDLPHLAEDALGTGLQSGQAGLGLLVPTIKLFPFENTEIF